MWGAEALLSLKRSRFFMRTKFQTSEKSTACESVTHEAFLYLWVQGKNKNSQDNHISRKMSLTSIISTNTHYEDEWVHGNTITYSLACKTSCDLLTQPLIRAIREAQSPGYMPTHTQIAVHHHQTHSFTNVRSHIHADHIVLLNCMWSRTLSPAWHQAVSHSPSSSDQTEGPADNHPNYILLTKELLTYRCFMHKMYVFS